MMSPPQSPKAAPSGAVLASGHETRPLRGVVVMAVALLFLACMDATTKLLSQRFEIPMIVAVRYAVALVLLGAATAPRHGAAILRTHRLGLVLLRGVALASASVLFGLGLTRIGVPEATAIGFLAPIMVMLAARPVLGERVGALGWIATGLGFTGVVLIARPGGGLDPVGVGLVLATVALAGTYQFLSRSLARTETTVALAFFSNLVGAVAFGLMLPWFWPSAMPSGGDLALLLAVGCFSAIGHFLVTTAFRFAPASLLAPASYVQMIWAGAISVIVFGHVPDGLALIGMTTIAASGVITALRSRRMAPAKT